LKECNDFLFRLKQPKSSPGVLLFMDNLTLKYKAHTTLRNGGDYLPIYMT